MLSVCRWEDFERMSHTCKNYPSIDKTLNPGTYKWPGSSMDSSPACYAVHLSSSINGSSINRCAENTDGRNFLHLNSPSVNINRVHLHTVHTFDDKGLKTLTRHSPLHPMMNVKGKHWLVKFQTVVHSIQRLLRPFRAHLWQPASQLRFISTNVAGTSAPYPSPDWKSANLLQLRCGEQDLNLYDLVGSHE